MKNNKQYVQSNDGIVYKVMPNYLLQLSPWKDGEDRRVFENDYGDYKVITYKNACMIVNTQFNDTTETWEHRGKHYVANAIGKSINTQAHSYMLSTLPNHNILIKDANKMLDYLPQNTLSIQNEDGSQELKLVKHKGKIYYIMIINEFLPRVKAYNMFGEFCQWIGIGNCKPIFCETDNRYI